MKYRPPECPSEIVITERRRLDPARAVQWVVGSEGIIADELIGIAVKLAGTGFRDYVDLATGRATEFRRVVTAKNLEFLKSIDARIIQQRQVSAPIDVVCPINGPAILRWARTIDREIDLVGLAATCRIGNAHVDLVRGARAHSGHERDQLFVVAIVERQLPNLGASDRGTLLCRLELHRDGRLLYCYLFRDAADLQGDGERQLIIHIEYDAGQRRLLEALRFDRDRVLANRQDGRGEVAIRIGYQACAQSGPGQHSGSRPGPRQFSRPTGR